MSMVARVQSPEDLYALLRERIRPFFPELARFHSTTELEASAVYRSIESEVRAVLESPETGEAPGPVPPAKDRYRLLAWNIERGIHLDAQIEALLGDAYLRTCDVLLLTEADIGMARSANRAVPAEMAAALGMNYAFLPCYINLAKGAGAEHDAEGENELGLHGNAILSRYPIRQVRGIPLTNGRDKMAGREKRLGRQVAVAAQIDLPGLPLTAVSVHLDAQSTQRHRREQMRDILNAVDGVERVVIGGDWNTSTYNSSRALHAILGYCLRVAMGVDNVIRNHYLYPDRLFERRLFRLLESRGFDYRNSNCPGAATACYDILDARARRNLAEWVPAWCFPFIRWALRSQSGRCPLKLDWFAVRGARCEAPVVIRSVREGRAVPLSDHDAIGLDVRA